MWPPCTLFTEITTSESFMMGYFIDIACSWHFLNANSRKFRRCKPTGQVFLFRLCENIKNNRWALPLTSVKFCFKGHQQESIFIRIGVIWALGYESANDEWYKSSLWTRVRFIIITQACATKAARNLLVRILISIKKHIGNTIETSNLPFIKQWYVHIQNILWSSWVRICNTKEQGSFIPSFL